MLVPWLFTVLMVFAGLTALCAFWAIFGCIKDAVSRNTFSTVIHAHDVERNVPVNSLESSRSNTALLTTSPPQGGVPAMPSSPRPVQEVEEALNRPNAPAPPLEIVSPHTNTIPLPVSSSAQCETPVTVPSSPPVQSMEVLNRQNTVPASLHPIPLQIFNRREQGVRRTRTVAEGSRYRMVALLVPEDHRIFGQRDRIVMQTRALAEPAENANS